MVRIGKDDPVPVDRSELSSLAALVDQVLKRIGQMGEDAASAKQDDVANELFGIERELTVASRRLGRMLSSRRPS